MAGYAAELQAQIAEKEKRRKLQRQESLRQSQDLLAQRMTVPSGLVNLHRHNTHQIVPCHSCLEASLIVITYCFLISSCMLNLRFGYSLKAYPVSQIGLQHPGRHRKPYHLLDTHCHSLTETAIPSALTYPL